MHLIWDMSLASMCKALNYILPLHKPGVVVLACDLSTQEQKYKVQQVKGYPLFRSELEDGLHYLIQILVTCFLSMLCMYVCVHMCVHVWVCACVYMWKLDNTLGIIPQAIAILCFETGSVIGLELINQATLVGQQSLIIYLFPPLQHSDYKYAPSHQLFYIDYGDQTQAIMFTCQARYQSCLSSP